MSQSYNGFDLLCCELDIDLETLHTCIRSDPQQIIQQINRLEIAAFPMLLEKELRLKGSQTPFITSGTDLRLHLSKIFQQMARGSQFETPLEIRATKEITAFLQKKIGKTFSRLTEKIVASTPIGKLSEFYDKENDLKVIANHFGELVSRYLSTPVMISSFLHVLRDDKSEDVVEQSTRSAFVAMAALSCHEDFSLQSDHLRQKGLVEMGLAILFQDIACLVEDTAHDKADPEHCPKSAAIAKEMGLPAGCIAAIGHHHRTVDENGNPILTTQTPSLLENMAVVINDFLHCITSKILNLDVDQAFYVLSHYADNLFYAKDCLRALGRLCIGEDKQQIISKAFYFIRQCQFNGRPFLWDISTPFPNRFLCQKNTCRHLRLQEIILYHSIQFDNPVHPMKIPAGRYFKCDLLTKQFNNWLHKTIL